MARNLATGNHDSAVIGERFRLRRAPTALARTASVAPIVFTRLRSDAAALPRTGNVPSENAYLFHVQLQPVAADMWIDGKLTPSTTTVPGMTFLYDLRSNPVADIYSPFDNIRVSVAQASLDEIAFDQGLRRTKALVPSGAGSPDRVMYGLATALIDPVERANNRSTLFIDHIALAFCVHAIRTYGNGTVADEVVPGRLSPWQLRRVLDFLTAHIGDDPTVAELARECGLSSGHFSRAFRRTTGATPHQWLIRKRVERARRLLLGDELGLAEVAHACGFVDQSHFNRVFTKLEGDTPGRWRQRNR